ncbi:MAG: hypothetical protein ACK5Q5_09695 [Planctomycetaceae bacterium]
MSFCLAAGPVSLVRSDASVPDRPSDSTGGAFGRNRAVVPEEI